MGIRLDWEIEAEQTQVHNGGEDPFAARTRRRARLRFFLVLFIFLAICGVILAAVNTRLQEVDAQIENLLSDTVQAEVAALRIGDYKAFAAIQRSASEKWLLSQQELFDDYQQLKVEKNVQLTGRVLDVVVEKERGRVHVEEIIDGVPYTRIWYYWRYEDGWRHVPPDYTFWGDSATVSEPGVTIAFQSVDRDLAQIMVVRIRDWLAQGCSVLTCGELPQVTVEIIPDDGLVTSWSETDPWRMQMKSPHLGDARSDMPFDLDLQLETSTLLAERLVTIASNDLKPIYPTDSWYLRQAVINWLVGRFVQIDTNSFLMESLAQNYGDQAVGMLLQLMQPASNVDIFVDITGVGSLNQANLDWRDLLTWRLLTEDELVVRGDLNGFLSFYDTDNELIRSTAILRYDTHLPPEPKVVVLVIPETDTDGVPLFRISA